MKLIETGKCIANSDVISKAGIKLLEALKTMNLTTITTVVVSLYPKVIEECKKCMGEE